MFIQRRPCLGLALLVAIFASASVARAEENGWACPTETSGPPPQKLLDYDHFPSLEDADCQANQISMNYCAQQRYYFAEVELESALAATLHVMDPGPARERFEKSQAAWCTYRDLICDYEYHGYEGGSAAPFFLHECLAAYNRHRAGALRQFTFCYQDGCAGDNGLYLFEAPDPKDPPQ